jgi:hypothetical protein
MRDRRVAKRDYLLSHICTSVLSVCLSVGMEQVGFHWTDFHEIWYLSTFRKSVKKIQG